MGTEPSLVEEQQRYSGANLRLFVPRDVGNRSSHQAPAYWPQTKKAVARVHIVPKVFHTVALRLGVKIDVARGSSVVIQGTP